MSRKPKRWTVKHGSPMIAAVYRSEHDAYPVGSVWTCHPKDFDASGVRVHRFLANGTGPWVAHMIAVAPASLGVAIETIRAWGYEPDEEWTREARLRSADFIRMLKAISQALPELVGSNR